MTGADLIKHFIKREPEKSREKRRTDSGLKASSIHGSKVKNDKIDSYKIALLLKAAFMPTVYAYPANMRSTCRVVLCFCSQFIG